ncbi:MAG: polysaccharide biosynthesis C-terminal domain-containing protein [Acidobacteria bacterium]|nr:polysaccharide biosynthesis C-terminal domain-containing protein [Acidobacteriota bacterium]
MEMSTNIARKLSPESGTLGRNFLWMSWSGVVSIANSVLVWIFMARMRDLDEVGRFTIVMGLYSLFFSIVSLGLQPYLVNEISRRRSNASENPGSIDQLHCAAIFLLLVSGVVCAFLMTCSGFVISASWEVRIATLVLSLAMIATGPGVVCEATAIAEGRGKLIATVSTVENVLRTAIPLALIWYGFGLVAICASFAAVRAVSVAIYFASSRVSISKFRLSFAVLRQLATAAPTFAATITVASINWQAPIFLLGFASTELESAEFGAASRFLIPVTILMASYANAIHPMMAKHKESSPDSFGRYLTKMASYAAAAAAIVAAGSLLLSGPVLAMLFGENYRRAAPALDLLALSVIPFCLVMVVARGLISLNSQRVDLIGNLLGVAVCIISGSLLIPKYGAIGAAASQLFSFLAIAAIEVAYLYRKIGRFDKWRTAAVSSASFVTIYLILWNQ